MLVRAFTRDVLRRDISPWSGESKQCLETARSHEEMQTSGWAAGDLVGGPGLKTVRQEDIKSTLEPKIDALRIDIGHLREDRKKLKDRVETTEKTESEMHLKVADATTHINDLQKEQLQQIRKGGPVATI
ncbi:hypothetical protein NDU88_006430 [Pleurodeles waltl]|uniref:Uncharacterized protein n=1 Tax=Pleurodeles waltl TaxID=8319 RepID=A0AAV7ULG8_PLEWA|nr:hypothetical protein NDU88_006430 [Pleurodeles waltl]